MMLPDHCVMKRGTVVISRLVALLTVVIISALGAQTANAFGFPKPPKSQVVQVSKDAQAMGMNLRIRKFTSQLSPDEVISFYAEKWSDSVITEYDPWLMIGRGLKGKYYNVQVQKKGMGSWGYLSVSDLPERLEKGDYQLPGSKPFPAMSGSTFLDDQEHSDPHKHGRTLMLSNSYSVDANSKFYLKHYKKKGWKLTGDTQLSKMKGRVLLLQKANKALNLTVNRMYGKTFVVANLVTGGVIDETK